MSQVILIKLVTGEEVIATKLTASVGYEEESGSVEIDKAFVMRIVPTPSGQVSITMMPLFMSDPTGTISLKSSAIVAKKVEINDTLLKEYLSRTSGIQIASAGLLNG